MRSVRWWPAALVLALGAGVLAWIWGFMEGTGQDRVTATFPVLFFVPLLLLVWVGFFSRLPGKVRVGIVVPVLATVILAVSLFEIRGVTGDLVPILGPRWRREPPPPRRPEVELEDPAPAPSPSFPQFLGPGRDGTLPAVRLARDWTARPPQLVWRREVGAGWAGFAVADGQAITQEQWGEEERVVSYELASGRLLWVHGDAARYETTIAGVGPRAVPAIDGGRVYTLGATGILNALDRASGRLLWRRDVVAEHGAAVPEWGKSCSPLVVDGRVVVSAGGADGRSLVAYDAETGEVAWRGGDDASGYSSPLAASLAGVPQVVIFNRASVVGHALDDGRVLWRFPWPPSQPNVSPPVVLPGDRLFVSSGYGIGGKLLAIAPDGGGDLEANLLWESPRLKAKFTNVVVHEGFLYGLDDGVLVCLDPATGERRWKRGRYGHGQVLLAGGLLLVQAEDGALVLLEPDPEEHRELARFQALPGKTWNPPALAGDLLLVRNDREAACYRLPLDG